MHNIVKKIIYDNDLLNINFSVQPVLGGSINNAYLVKGGAEVLFIKLNNNLATKDIFLREVQGLYHLKTSGNLIVPEVLKTGSLENFQYLILTYVHPVESTSEHWKNMGEAISELHKKTSTNFGLDHNNYIGGLPQNNECCTNWIDFFIRMRLEPQVEYYKRDSELYALKPFFEMLYNRLPDILSDELPSLLHGDLWRGNVITGINNKACFIDPAIYYGNREIEIAFTTLFNGFPKEFYIVYMENFPMAPGYEERFEIYNLYALMVHYNLFGGQYINQIKNILKKYTA